MLNTPALLLLTLYSAIIVVSYYVVRRGWLRAYPIFVLAGTANALVVFAFSLLRGNTLLQAVLVGPITGFLFVALSVVFATLFRDTVPAAKPILILQPDATTLPIERAHGTLS